MPTEDESSSILSIEKRLTGRVRTHYQAAAIAYEIYVHELKFPHRDHLATDDLRNKFFSCLREWECENLLEHQLRYAIRIARSRGELEYEEMHKLFSLCDEIETIRAMGLHGNASLDKEFAEALRFRFGADKRKAHLVAQDKFENWKGKWWWYMENL